MDHTQVSGRAVAKVVLIVAGVVGRPLLRLPDQGGRRPLPDRGVLRGRDHPGGQLAGPRAAFPAGSRSCSSTCRSAASIFGIGLLIVPPLVNGVTDLSNDLPGYVDDLRHNETFRDYDDRYHITEKLTEQARPAPEQARRRGRHAARRDRRRLQPLRAAVLDPRDHLLPRQGRAPIARTSSTDSCRRSGARRLRKIAADISDAIAGYVFGNFVISVLAGLVTYVTLRILGVPFAAPAGDPVRVLRPDPAGRRDPGRDPGRDRRRLRQLPGRADRLGRGADPLPADREQPDPAVRLRQGRRSSIP